MNILQGLFFGLISGLTDILPVSSQAHRTLMVTFMGLPVEPGFLRLMTHIAILAALYWCNQNHIIRIIRQRKLSKIPKRKRKRPVDLRTVLDFRILRTASIPILLGFFLYPKISQMAGTLNWIALYAFVNSVVLFLPSVFPSGNKDSRNMTPLDGIYMGLGGFLSMLPGISSVGAITSIGTVCGGDRTYALNLSLLLHMVVTAGLIVFDIISIATAGLGIAGFSGFLAGIFAAVFAFIGAFAGIRIMRTLAVNNGFLGFCLYSLGLALLSFILYLTI